MSEAEQLMSKVCEMLRQRAYRGNCQTKHGIDAAYDWEVYNFVDTMDKWLTRWEHFKAVRGART